MPRLHALTAAVVLVLMTQAQNLVPNWSFENYSTCPDNYGQVDHCVDWYPSWNNNDPAYHTEYLTTCGTSMFSVPNNIWGYQQASTGQAYMAEVSMAPSVMTDYRENIYAELLQPLMVDTEYRISLKISNCENSQYASNNFGVKFATVSSFPIDGICALHGSTVVTDQNGWTIISGNFTADSAYTYIAVGNFIPDASTTTDHACPSCDFILFGYYVDDVCVVQKHAALEGDCSLDVIAMGMQGTSVIDFQVFATIGTIELQRSPGEAVRASITVIDAGGRACANSTWSAGQVRASVDLRGAAGGAYAVKVAAPSGTATKRVVLVP